MREKQQFLDNKGKFVDTLEYMKCMEIIKEFKTILYSSAALMFMTTVPIPPSTVYVGAVHAYGSGSGSAFTGELIISTDAAIITKQSRIAGILNFCKPFFIGIFSPR